MCDFQENVDKIDLGYEIYYINLKRNPERNLNFSNHYKNITRIDAYDGQKLEEYNDIIIDKKLKKEANDSEIGCSLSHIKAIITAYDNNKEEILIMEDDIYCNYNSLWQKSLKEIITNRPKFCTCLQLHVCHPGAVYKLINTDKKYNRREDNYFSCGCYYINRLGMKIIKTIYLNNNKIEFNSNYCDGVADGNVIYHLLNTYSYKNPLFDNSIMSSNIQEVGHLNFSANLDVMKWFYKKNTNYKNYKNVKVCCICRRKIISNSENTDYLFCKDCNNLTDNKSILKMSSNICKKLFSIDINCFEEKFDNLTKINEIIKIPKKLIFTCTSYLRNHEKYEILNKTLDTFFEYNKDDLYLIDDFLIIMEFTPLNNDYIEELKNKYPIIKFIVKEEYQKGQSKSINMIIDKLKDYDYWLHWEDSWYSTGPTLKESYEIMENSDVNNYQLTKRPILHNMPVIENEYISCKIIQDKYKTIKPNNELKKLWRYWEINDFDFTVWKDNGCWPFYSLTPSMSKVDTIINTGYYNEDVIKWPFQFEFEWALKWVRKNNITIGIPKDIKVERKDSHSSTYSNEDYQRWLIKLENREEREKYNRNVNYHTLKSDKKEIIIFWNPGIGCDILKKFIYNIEEEFVFDGDDITKEIGELNYNKYFVEINSTTLERFKNYKKILVTKDNLIKIPKDWIDEIIDVNDINLLLNRYY